MSVYEVTLFRQGVKISEKILTITLFGFILINSKKRQSA